MREIRMTERSHSIGIDSDKCIGCVACSQVCPTLAIRVRENLARVNAELCIDCGECERVCPVGIPLNRINRKMARVVQDRFGYEAGLDRTTPSPFTTNRRPASFSTSSFGRPVVT